MKIAGSLILLIYIVLIQACSTKQIYESVQHRERIECRDVPYSEYDECMERSSVSYGKYKEKREEIIEDK